MADITPLKGIFTEGDSTALGEFEATDKVKPDHLPFDTDATLSANSDVLIATQKAVKAYCDQLIAAANATVYKGAINCSANPNYPAADSGHLYRISIAGKIGGASGVAVEAGDIALCIEDGTDLGDQATVGTKWNVIQANTDGVVIGPATATDNAIALFDQTTGKLLKNSAKTIVTTLGSDDNTLPTSKAVKDVTDTKATLSNGRIAGFNLNKTFAHRSPNADCTANGLVVPVIPTTAADLTFTNVEVACDINPTTEITGDLKYADDPITLANPVVINDFDTTDGKRSDNSLTNGAVPAGKFVYIHYDTAPEVALKWINHDYTYDYD